MTAMGRKENKIAFAEFPILGFAFEAKPRSALDQEDPLVTLLIVLLTVG